MGMGRLAVSAAVIALAALISTPATAQPQMRCNASLVQIGDYKVEVLLKCGQPFFTERFYIDGGRFGPCASVDQWAYYQGQSKFLRILEFERGRLTRIIAADRPPPGFRPDPP